MRTIIQVGTADESHRVELKGNIPEPEAVRRAKHIIRANTRLDQPTLGYLLSCMDNGTYELTTETDHA